MGTGRSLGWAHRDCLPDVSSPFPDQRGSEKQLNVQRLLCLEARSSGEVFRCHQLPVTKALQM